MGDRGGGGGGGGDVQIAAAGPPRQAVRDIGDRRFDQRR
jgi:hypothetical protein